jgi:phosphoribosylaminoimidazolecarboxamide formyltransferase / IMP cyclohydrolase
VGSASTQRVPLRRALLSVSDATGLEALARGLHKHGIEIWATEGTARGLAATGLPIHAAEELTGIGSWFGGRVKTLHPGILGGILAPRTEGGLRELGERHLHPIDLVVTNFYPFEERFRADPSAEDLEEMIDVGGVTLARAAAKNHAAVAILTSPDQYAELLRELEEGKGSVSAVARRAWAARAFERTHAYDRLIAEALAHRDPSVAPATEFPAGIEFEREPGLELRYGENPHQRARAYRLKAPAGAPLPLEPLDVLQGEALSFNNLVDLETSLAIVAEFPAPTAAVVKHATPTGVASGGTITEALERALATDPVARYGCVIAVNRPLDEAALAPLHGVFIDLLVAPGIADAARTPLGRRKKLKLVRGRPPPHDRPRWEARTALGRLLLEEVDQRNLKPEEFNLVTTSKATPEELASMEFAWRVVRHAKSNAIVLARGSATVGIGAGQTSRVQAVEIACAVAGERARGAVLASDAFFPFADGVEAAAKAGVRAILQPGGSVRDPEVIRAAQDHGLAMYLTGWRVFRH